MVVQSRGWVRNGRISQYLYMTTITMNVMIIFFAKNGSGSHNPILITLSSLNRQFLMVRSITS